MDHLTALRTSVVLVDELVVDAALDPDGDARPTPCSEFDVAALVDHLVDTHIFLATAAGAPVAPSADGDRTQRLRDAGAAAVETWTDRGDGGTVELGGHDLPAEFALGLHALETFVHGWDLAAATGRPFTPGDELVSAAWEQARMVVSDDARSDASGAPYGPAFPLDGAADVSDLDRVVAFTGRDPYFGRR